MFTLVTAYFVRVLLSSTYGGKDELYPVAMWFVALFLDAALVMAALFILFHCG